MKLTAGCEATDDSSKPCVPTSSQLLAQFAITDRKNCDVPTLQRPKAARSQLVVYIQPSAHSLVQQPAAHDYRLIIRHGRYTP